MTAQRREKSRLKSFTSLDLRVPRVPTLFSTFTSSTPLAISILVTPLAMRKLNDTNRTKKGVLTSRKCTGFSFSWAHFSIYLPLLFRLVNEENNVRERMKGNGMRRDLYQYPCHSYRLLMLIGTMFL